MNILQNIRKEIISKDRETIWWELFNIPEKKKKKNSFLFEINGLEKMPNKFIINSFNFHNKK